MARKFFYYYVLISFVLCIIFTASRLYPMPFDYEQIFTVSEIFHYSLYIFWGVFVFYISQKLTRGGEVHNSYNFQFDLTNSVSSRYVLPALLLQVFILSYFLIKISIGLDSSDGEQYIKNYRPLGDKISVMLLLSQSFLPIILWRVKLARVFAILSCVFLAFIFSWIDASRASILPLIGVAYVFYTKRSYFLLLCVSIVMVCLFMTAIIARSYIDRISFDSLIEIVVHTYTNFSEVCVWVVSYFTAFSIYQFAYIVRDGLGDFTSYDLIYSVIPLPSFLWSNVPDYDNWRADEFRPMGALSEILRVSILAFTFFFFILGVLAKKIDCMTDRYMKLLSVFVFSMTTVMIFQYNLRTVQWFYYFLFFLVLYDKTPNLKLKKIKFTF
ncbi:hypothetical protein EOE67_09700 [Rheinheimera riviphila]|uniref:Oligosaccharide repeat unit polymerase n=1 Tax=Rheinheimera riviphila TaxID=1834037 RepID=A0A437QSG1_9GAMM|nr:hypothetical protein [Rheinheimera riviphila]RVU37456.1 hypothetical protein EOE67_09700 [Rheinheimera riviphila]